jgi:hypothetical protein
LAFLLGRLALALSTDHTPPPVVRLRLVRGEESLIGFSDPIGKRPLGLLPRMAGAFVQRAAALMLASIALSVFTSIATVRYTTSGCTVSMPGLEVRGRIATEGRTPLQRDTRRRNGDQSTYHGEKLEPFQPKMQPSAWNSSYSLGCDSGNVSRAWTHVYKGETTSGKECGFRRARSASQQALAAGRPLPCLPRYLHLHLSLFVALSIDTPTPCAQTHISM